MTLPPVTGFSYNKLSNTLSWDTLPNAENYEIRYKLALAPNFLPAYFGPNNHCSLELEIGTYDFSGRGESTGGGMGLWTEPPEEIEVH